MLLSAAVLRQDKNNDGSITHAEFIKGLRENPWIADLLGPSRPMSPRFRAGREPPRTRPAPSSCALRAAAGSALPDLRAGVG